MRPGATIMSSFLFNTALILIATTAVIQFCATAFAQYADGTSIVDIFGNQVSGRDRQVHRTMLHCHYTAFTRTSALADSLPI